MLHIKLKGMKRKAICNMQAKYYMTMTLPPETPASADKSSATLHCFRYVSSLVGYHAMAVMLLHYIVYCYKYYLLFSVVDGVRAKVWTYLWQTFTRSHRFLASF